MLNSTGRPAGLGSLSHGGGRVILGAPDVDKIGPQLLQQRGKGGGAGHNTVVHAVRAAGCLCLADTQHGQMQRRVRLQRGKLPVSQLPLTSLAPASPQAAAACGSVVLTSQRICIYIHLKNSFATYSGVNSG